MDRQIRSDLLESEKAKQDEKFKNNSQYRVQTLKETYIRLIFLAFSGTLQ